MIIGNFKFTEAKAAFEKVGDKMPFLFDYGAGWTLLVECLDNSDPSSTKS